MFIFFAFKQTVGDIELFIRTVSFFSSLDTRMTAVLDLSIKITSEIGLATINKFTKNRTTDVYHYYTILELAGCYFTSYRHNKN